MSRTAVANAEDPKGRTTWPDWQILINNNGQVVIDTTLANHGVPAIKTFMRLNWYLQAKGRSLTMAWSMLPEDMEGLILGNLSHMELGCVSTTCRSYHGFFSRRMAELQKARCDLAVERFSHGMITGIADIINCFLKGESLDSRLAFKFNHCQFSPDGLLQVEDTTSRQMPGHQGSAGVRGTFATIIFHAQIQGISISVPAPDESSMMLWVHQAENQVEVIIGGNKDLVGLDGVAFVQALLTRFLGHKSDAWPHVHVIIQMVGSTRAERRAQFAPLLHLRPQHTNLRIDWWDR